MGNVSVVTYLYLRGHSLKLSKKRVRLDISKYSFSNRVINEWNMLDKKIIEGMVLKKDLIVI